MIDFDTKMLVFQRFYNKNVGFPWVPCVFPLVYFVFVGFPCGFGLFLRHVKKVVKKAVKRIVKS